MLDLNLLPDRYIAQYGRPKVAEITGQSSSILSMWISRKKFPIDAVQKLLEFDPTPLHEIQPLYTNPEVGKKLVILVPLSGSPAPKMVDCLLKLYDRKEMEYHRIAFNCLSVSRNALAATFLRSSAEWAFWMDGDSVLPCGDAAWFKRETEAPNMSDVFAGVHAIHRLLVHRKSIVSCCYVGRKKGAPPQFGGGDTPEMRQNIRRGPRDQVIEVPWTGFGGILTHRKVFEDIIKTQGEELKMKSNGVGARFNYEYGFFDPTDRESPGDDVPWSNRAVKAGHKIHVDLAVMAAHVGDRAYTFADL